MGGTKKCRAARFEWGGSIPLRAFKKPLVTKMRHANPLELQ